MREDFDSLPDDELISLTRQGEKEAYGILWSRYCSAGLAYASRIARSDPEDLVVEAYTKILRAIQTGRGPKDSFLFYLYATIRNVMISQYRKFGSTVPGLEDVTSDAMPVEGDVLSAIDAERISRVMSLMRPVQQKILWLSQAEERTTAEIAAELGMTQTNVTTSVQRSRQEFVRLWMQDHVCTTDVKPGSEHAYVLSHAGKYMTGKPTPRLRARVEAHLAKCDTCSAELAEARSIARLFRSRLAPVAASPTMVVMAEGKTYAVAPPTPKSPPTPPASGSQ